MIFDWIDKVVGWIVRRLFGATWTVGPFVSEVQQESVPLSHTLVAGSTCTWVEFGAVRPLLSFAWPPALRAGVRRDGKHEWLDASVEEFTASQGCREFRVRVSIPPDSVAELGQVVVGLWMTEQEEPVAMAVATVVVPGDLVRQFTGWRWTTTGRYQGREATGTQFHDAIEELAFDVTVDVDDGDHRTLLTDHIRHLEIRLVPSGSQGRTIVSRQCALRSVRTTVCCSGSLSREDVRNLGAGGYELFVWYADVRLSSQSFQVTRLALRTAEVRAAYERSGVAAGIEWRTVDQRGRVQPLDVVAEDFLRIVVAMRIEVPEVERLLGAVEVPLQVLLASAVSPKPALSIREEVALRSGANPVCIELSLDSAWYAAGPGRYHLRLELGNRVVAETAFVHKTRQTLREEKAESIFESLRLLDFRRVARRDGATAEVEEYHEDDASPEVCISIAGEGFDEDHPAIRWRLTLNWRCLESGESTGTQVLLEARAGPNHYSLSLPPGDGASRLAPGTYELKLRKRSKVLRTAKIRVLSVAELVNRTRTAVLESVRVEGAKLFLLAAGARFESDVVAHSTDFIVPEFRLVASGFNRYVDEVTAEFSLVVQAESTERVLLQQPIRLRRAGLDVSNVQILFAGTRLSRRRGPVRLCVNVGDREVGHLDFAILGIEEFASRVRVTDLALNATLRDGQVLATPPTLPRDRTISIGPSFTIETDVVAPNVAMAARLVLSQEGQSLAAVSFEIDLGAKRQVRTTRTVPVSGVFAPGRALLVAVEIEGARKASLSVLVLDRQTLTNFEGALVGEAAGIPIDPSAHASTLARLGI